MFLFMLRHCAYGSTSGINTTVIKRICLSGSSGCRNDIFGLGSRYKWWWLLLGKRPLSTTTAAATTTTTTTTKPSDSFQFYRTPSEQLSKFIQDENEQALHAINMMIRTEDDDDASSSSFVAKMEHEIIQLEQEVSSSVRRQDELGPTGHYLYQTVMDTSNGQLQYSRKHLQQQQQQQKSCGSRMEPEITDRSFETVPVYQNVIHVDLKQYQVKAMSLSVDETMIAYILVPVISEQQPQQSTPTPELWIKDIDNNVLQNVIPPMIREGRTLHVALVEWGGSSSWSSLEEEERKNLGFSRTHQLFFTTTDEWNRPDTVYACQVEQKQDNEKTVSLTLSNPIQIFHTPDNAVMVDIQRTKGCHYMTISASTKTSSEIYLVPLSLSLSTVTPGTKSVQQPLLIRSRQAGIQYHVDIGKTNDVYLLASATQDNNYHRTTDLDEELSLFQTSIHDLPLTSNHFGTPIVNHATVSTALEQTVCDDNKDEFVITDMDIFQHGIVLYERSIVNGQYRIRIKDRMSPAGSVLATSTNATVNDTATAAAMKEVCHPSDHIIHISEHQLVPAGNMYYDASEIQYTVESPILPPTSYEYAFATKKLTKLDDGISCDIRNWNEYLQKRLLVKSHDGVQVPITLFHHQELNPYERQNPVVLVGYGAYGEQTMGGFDSTIIPLIDRGVIVAYAHTRGGGDVGRSAWYHDGRLYNKHNAIEDYLACARALTDIVVEPANLTAKAFSAGGVTVGAAINRSPELFGSAVLINAFLDVTTSMYNKMALTEHEYEEWGDPTTDERAASCIASYCPMANLDPNPEKNFPRMMIVGTLDDMNVPYWHALTYYAKLNHSLQNNSETDKRHLLYMLPQGGHHMHGYRLEVATLTNSFILGNCTFNQT